MPGTRKRAARNIRNLFILVIRQGCGGFIERSVTDDVMSGLYEVHIWTRAMNRDDPILEPLWQFIIGLLNVEGFTINMEQGEPAEDRFRDRFFLSFHDAEPEDWSSGNDLVEDDDSVISIDSIHYH